MREAGLIGLGKDLEVLGLKVRDHDDERRCPDASDQRPLGGLTAAMSRVPGWTTGAGSEMTGATPFAGTTTPVDVAWDLRAARTRAGHRHCHQAHTLENRRQHDEALS
jgi:hypothetical protein